MTETSEGANLANTIRGLKKFDGRNPAEFKTWMKKLCVVISVTKRDILPLLKGTARPTHTSNIAEYNRVVHRLRGGGDVTNLSPFWEGRARK